MTATIITVIEKANSQLEPILAEVQKLRAEKDMPWIIVSDYTPFEDINDFLVKNSINDVKVIQPPAFNESIGYEKALARALFFTNDKDFIEVR